MASIQKYGAATGPTAGASLVSLTGLRKGRYRVVVATGVEGTGTVADNDNMQLLNGAGTVSVVLASYGGVARVPNPEMVVDVADGGTLAVGVIGNAGTAAIYAALIVATPEALY